MRYHIPQSRGCQIDGIEDIYMKYIGYKNNGYYVEVGAFDGLAWTNSECFAIAGWNGILIEPQKILAKKCIDNYKNYRNIIIEECAIGNYNGNIELFGSGSLATTSYNMVEKYKTINWSKGTFKNVNKSEVKIFTLDYILKKYSYPDLDVLIVDTEGTEYEVLCGFNIKKWKPKMIIVECMSNNKILSREKDVDSILIPSGYKSILRGLNNIYIRNF